MITQIRKYPARCKNEDKNVAINMVHTAKKRKHMHIEFSIDVIQTAKYRKDMHITFGLEMIKCTGYHMVLSGQLEEILLSCGITGSLVM